MLKHNKDFLHDGPISIETISNFIASSEEKNIGANSIFLGKIRADLIDGKSVSEIEYSTYKPLVEVEMLSIFDSILLKFSEIKQIKIIHSIGIVCAGQYSLLVQIECSHRAQSFKALQETVELVKKKLPIWKKVIFSDGSYYWA